MVKKSGCPARNLRRREAYAWLKAGAFGIGIGAAAIAGPGIAHADEGAGDPQSTSSVSSQSTEDEPSASRAPSSPDTADITEDSAGADPTPDVLSDADNPALSAESGGEPEIEGRSASSADIEDASLAVPVVNAADDAVLADAVSGDSGGVSVAGGSGGAGGGKSQERWRSSVSEPAGAGVWVVAGLDEGEADSAGGDVGGEGDAVSGTVNSAVAAVGVSAGAVSDADGVGVVSSGAGGVSGVPSSSVLAVMSAGSGALADQGPAVPAVPNPLGELLVAVFRQLRSTLFNSRPSADVAHLVDSSVGGVATGVVGASDRDGDPLTYTVAAGPANGQVVLDADGGFVYTASQELAATGGSDSFTVRVAEANAGSHIHGFRGLIARILSAVFPGAGINDGSWIETTVTVAVAQADSIGGSGVPGVIGAAAAVVPANTAPTAVADRFTVTAGIPRRFTAAQLVGNDTDPDKAHGDVLAVNSVASRTGGRVRLNSDGSVTFTPTDNYTGPASFIYRVKDSTGTTSTNLAKVSLTIKPNTAPRAVADRFTVTAGIPRRFTAAQLVGNDTDPDKARGDVLAVNSVASRTGGKAKLNTDGSVTFTPTANYTGPASFIYRVKDSTGTTSTNVATVKLTTKPAPPPPGPLPAFPGAEGFGAYASGGRGGSVVYVTNTNASGVGSLQWAIDQPGAKYILFKTSGVINARIHLRNGDVTIAGQTSPGGITIRGFVTDETPYQDQAVRAPSDFAENWILQHIRIRPGSGGPSDDGLRLRYTRNAIVDHVSIGNATDEAVEISYSNNITIQNSILAETLGGHSFYGGVLMNYSNPAHGFGLDNIALHHNVFNRIEGRLPEGSRESLAAANSRMNLELSNNLYWDPRFFIALSPDTNVVTNSLGNPYPIYWNINAVNNYFRVGNQFPYGMFDDQILRVAGNRLYVSGNQMSRYPSRSDYDLFYCCNDFASTTPSSATHRAEKLTSRHAFPTISYTPTDLLRTALLNTAGAWPRDPMDIRLLQSVAQNTISSASPSTNPANDALRPAYSGAAPAAPQDSDNDGMPDVWEISKGLNPNVANHNATTISGYGYTDLEVYLHELSAIRVDPTRALG